MTNLRSALIGLLIASCFCVGSPAFAQERAPAPPSSAPTVALSGLFESTMADFRKLPSSETLTWLTIGGVAAVASHAKDWDITKSFSKSRRLNDVFKSGEAIGGGRAQLGAAIVTYTLGRLTAQPRITNVGADLIRAQIVAQTMTAGIKLSARRMRPDGGEFSFPSGHTSVTFASATVLQRHFGWKAGVPAYAVASYVAASRVQVKRHFASDVAFGAALGVVAGRSVTVGRGRTRFAMSPTVSSHHAGVSFTLLEKR